jgi:tight adherence protein C
MQAVPDVYEEHLSQPFLTRVLRPLGGGVLDLVSSVTPRAHRDRVQGALQQAGLATTYRAEEIIASQAIGGLVGLLLALAIAGFGLVGGMLALVLLVLLPTAGVVFPVSRLNHAVAQRHATILKDLPDTLDLLAISVEAGVGLEGAMDVVCQRFDSPLADEFAQTLREMGLGLTRRDALQSLKRRTEVPELSNFVLALIQADTLGMPVGRVLKAQAAEMRIKRRQWARERAAKLPVKIMFPLVACIFPAILVILLGPAASSIQKAMK